MRMTHLLVLFALAVPAAAQGPIPPAPLQKPGTAKPEQAKVADALDELKAEWDALVRTPRQSDAEVKAFTARSADIARRAKALMRDDPRGDLAVRTRIWVAFTGIEPGASARLVDEILEKDLASPALVDLLDWLRPGPQFKHRDLLDAVAEKAGDRTVRGRSARLIADHAKADLDLLKAVVAGNVAESKLGQAHGPERAAELLELGVTGLQARYEVALERVVEEYADVLDSRGRALGPRAEGALFEMRHLAIGQLAPDIEGEDVDGVPFKLSDYRGKVVMLDFWGHW